MVNPLWLLPSVIIFLPLAAWLGATVDPRIERAVSRIGRVGFDRFVSENADRRRIVESAYVDTPYPTYASTTLLFTVLAFVAGAVAGGYVTAGVLFVLEDAVRLLSALPSAISGPIGARSDYELVLTSTERWLVLVASGLVSGLVSAGIAYLLRWMLPKSTAEVRRRSIDEGLSRTSAFMYALSRGGLGVPAILRALAENSEVYGESAREANVVVRQMDLFGRDVVSAFEKMTDRTPSEQFKTFTENLSSVLQSGSSLPDFFSDQYDRFREDAESRQEQVLEVLATIAEGYVTVLVAGVLFFITILLVFGLTTTDTLLILQLIGYLIIPLANGGFAVFLNQQLQSLGIASQSGADALDRLNVATPIRPSPPAERRRSDGGGVAERSENALILGWTDRIRQVKSVLRDPIRTVIWSPTTLLYVTVPIALGAVLLRAPPAFAGAGVNLRLLDDVLVQSTLFLLGTYAIVRYLYKRRIDRIEAATPDLLERLASLNESGMSIVEGFDRVRGGDLGVLSPEVDRIWRDIEYGATVGDALIRFGRRIRTISVTRVVVLLNNAMGASGNMGPVLRIAADQSRSDIRLKRQRRQQMLTYLVVIYISFLVFLVIVVAVNDVLVPSLPNDPIQSTGGESSISGGGGALSRLGQADKTAYTLVFFHTGLIQAVVSGFIAGQLGEGRLRDGAKHAAIMLGIAYLLFVIISAPVASIGASEAATTGSSMRISSASLSDGGYLVVYDDGLNSTVLGRSAYLEPGRQTNIEITLDEPISRDRTVYVVPHQDTNNNQRFDYPGPPYSPGGGQPDRPYPAAATGSVSGREIDAVYTGG